MSNQSLCNGLGVELFAQTFPHNFNPGEGIAIFYGLLAWSAILSVALGVLVTRRISLIILLVFIGISTLISEVGLNSIPIPEQKRPPQSCVGANSFPSGHTQNALLMWSYLTLDTIFRSYWSITKKVLLIIAYLIAFIPQGPLRHVVGDHTWLQIGAGMGIGAALGILDYLFARFVFQVFILEKMMTWKITNFFHVKNDYQPNFENSKYEGKEYTAFISKHPPKAREPSRWQKLSTGVLILLNSIAPFLSFSLGIIGIIFSVYQSRAGACGEDSAEILRAIGVFAIILAFLEIAILVLIYLRIEKNHFKPDANQVCWFLISFFWFMGMIWNYCLEHSLSSGNCPRNDMAYSYVITFFACQVFSIVYMAVLYFAIELWTLFTSLEELRPKALSNDDYTNASQKDDSNVFFIHN